MRTVSLYRYRVSFQIIYARYAGIGITGHDHSFIVVVWFGIKEMLFSFGCSPDRGQHIDAPRQRQIICFRPCQAFYRFKPQTRLLADQSKKVRRYAPVFAVCIDKLKRHEIRVDAKPDHRMLFHKDYLIFRPGDAVLGGKAKHCTRCRKCRRSRCGND